MPPLTKLCSASLTVCAVLLLGACEGGPVDTGSKSGSLRVLVTTEGRVLDRDGYSLTVGGTAAGRARATDTVVVTGLEPGSRTVEIGDVASNCVLDGAATVNATVVAAATAEVRFTVRCVADRVAYVAERPGVGFSVYMEKLDGTERQALTGSVVELPIAWSPDGYFVAYSARRWDGSADIEVVDVHTGQTRLLTTSGSSGFLNSHPVWSPDGSRIVYSSKLARGGTGSDLQIMQADGSGHRTLASGREILNLFHPSSWSPGGETIALTVSYGSSRIVMLMDTTGTMSRMLETPDGGSSWDPAWSPDGTRLALSRRYQFTDELYVAARDLIGMVQITSSPALRESSSTWIDAETLGFTVSPELTRSEVWTIRADGTQLARSPVGNGLFAMYPRWQ